MATTPESQTTLLTRFRRAQDQFSELVAAIGPDQWSDATPCTEWDVRALVNHLVGEQLWAVPLVNGKTLDEVGSQFDGDLLGSDPVATWRETAAESRAAFEQSDALSGAVNTSMGPQPAAEYLADMTSDLIAHRWDLGKAIGQPQTLSDDELSQLEDTHERFAPMQQELVAAGIFAAPVTPPPNADRQARLVAAFGRSD